MESSQDAREVIQGTISDIALPSGLGVMRHEGRVVFVAGAAPGDVVSARVTGGEKRYLYATIMSLVEPSPSRVDPPCRHFGACGGCALQHIEYAKQLEVKERHVVESLRRIAGLEDISSHMLPAVASPRHYRYRNKLELVITETDGSVSAGFRQSQAGHSGHPQRIIAVEDCALFPQSAQQIISAVTAAVEEGWGPKHARRRQGARGLLTIRTAGEGSPSMVLVGLAAPPQRAGERIAAALSPLSDAVESLYVGSGTAGSIKTRRFNYRLVRGNPYLAEEVNGLRLRISPHSFSQPNPSAAALLYEDLLVRCALQAEDKVLGLYCGAGPIELLMSRHAGAVLGVDSEAPNIGNARENCRQNGISNCLFRQGRAEEILKQLAVNSYSVVVADPPRAGILGDGVPAIAALGPRRVAYVSCHPSTLARDIARFRVSGYSLGTIRAFDFFPQTGHVETLAILERN